MSDRRLADLIGPMLGADLRYAEGEALDQDSDRSHAVRGTGGRNRDHGHALVDPATGRLHELATPGFTWTLLNVRDVATEEPAPHFRPPAAGP